VSNQRFSFETFTLIFILRATPTNANIWVRGEVPLQLDGKQEFQPATRAKIKFAVIASQTDVFALRTLLLAEVEQMAISSTLKSEYLYSSYNEVPSLCTQYLKHLILTSN
jgi:hypothetical protein